MKETEKALKNFFGNVIKLARKNLKRLGKNASSKLSKSLKSNVSVSKSGASFESDLSMEDYGDYVDKGVKGVGGRKADGSSWKKKKVTINKYKYRNKKPPAKVFDKWSVRKGVAPRSSGGKFQKRKGMQFAIANSVYHTGLETTKFLSKPFEDEFKNLPEEVVEAFGLDTEQLLKFSLKDGSN